MTRRFLQTLKSTFLALTRKMQMLPSHRLRNLLLMSKKNLESKVLLRLSTSRIELFHWRRGVSLSAQLTKTTSNKEVVILGLEQVLLSTNARKRSLKGLTLTKNWITIEK